MATNGGTAPRRGSSDHLIRQVMAVIFQHRPFLPPSAQFPGWSPSAIVDVLAAIPRYLFLSHRSVGRQPTTRHRSPLKQRQLFDLVGPAAHRDPSSLRLGVAKSLEFYHWVESCCGFIHVEPTCREMARLLAKANSLPRLWRFLRDNEKLVVTATVTAVIQVLGNEGLANEALAAFYRMKQLHCKPDVRAYNVVISALCGVGNLKKARYLLEQMELPGFRYPSDRYTYTILINCYCKRGMQTGSRKAIRRRIWEANHMFRHMLFKGFQPDVVTYNCLIDGLCKTYRIERALELFDDMIKRGCLPNRVTYNSFIRYFSVVNEVDKAMEMMRNMVLSKHGTPTSSSYTPIIHALCEGRRAKEAKGFLVEMVNEGSLPREFTYKLLCDSLIGAGEEGLPKELCRRIEEEMEVRFRQTMCAKPLMNRRSLSF